MGIYIRYVALCLPIKINIRYTYYEIIPLKRGMVIFNKNISTKSRI